MCCCPLPGGYPEDPGQVMMSVDCGVHSAGQHCRLSRCREGMGCSSSCELCRSLLPSPHDICLFATRVSFELSIQRSSFGAASVHNTGRRAGTKAGALHQGIAGLLVVRWLRRFMGVPGSCETRL